MNRIREYINIDPYNNNFFPEHKSTSGCENCCFGCNPQIYYITLYLKF